MKYLLFISLTFFFSALTYESAPAEFLPVDLIGIGVLVAVVIAAESFIVRILARFRLLENLALAGFTIVNILYLNLVLNEGFSGLPHYGQALALLIGTFIVFTLLDMIDRSRLAAKVLPALFVLAAVGVVVSAVIALIPAIPTYTGDPGKISAKSLRLVTFARKPNVYFVSFDSLIPKVLMKKHIGLETTAYHEVLDANFRRFRNFFADRVPSRPALNSVLALDIGYYDAGHEDKTSDNFFVGLRPSPLFQIFKHNGYETTTYFRGYHFGRIEGPYVDNYRFRNQGNGWTNNIDGACQLINTDGIRALTFFGYCSLIQSELYQNNFGNPEREDHADTLIRHMRDGLKKTTPQVFVAYLFSPGHTKQNFDSGSEQDKIEYRLAYREQSKITALFLDKLVRFIRDEDPSAILYVFGDHGAYTSRKTDIETNSVFITQDTYGVYGGIFPKDRCNKIFLDSGLENQNFLTVSKISHSIIMCLSDGVRASITTEDYQLPTGDSYLPKMKQGASKRYEDYLYE